MNSLYTFGNTVAVAPGSSFAAPPAPAPGGYPYPLAPGNGGYPYPIAPGNGGYPYPLAPGNGGYPLPQMQPQKKTSMVKKFAKKLEAFLCGLVRIAAFDATFDNN